MLHLLLDFFIVVHYKPVSDSPQQMHQHETVQKYDDDRLKNDWRKETTSVDKYEKHRPEVLEMLEEIDDIWVGHLRRTTK